MNPTVAIQLILLEETLTGRVTVVGGNDVDADEPILAGGGVPIENAYVVVYNERGDSAIAQERRTDPGSYYHLGGGGKGAGVYAFFNNIPIVQLTDPQPGPYFLRVARGARYRLVVRTADRRLTAATTVPDATGTTLLRNRIFNRDHDTLSLSLPAAPFTRRYSVHIETPYGPFELFTAEHEYHVRGDVRNTAARRRPRAFIPGFEQVISLGAVDTNYFDYFRTSNDTVTGRGLIEHVDGGIGVFGAYAPLDKVTLTIVADIDEPIEGRYVEDGTGKSLRLYVDERGAGLTRLSGSYGLVGGSTSGVLGQLEGTDVSLVFLGGQTLADTLYTVRGRWLNETIVGLRSDGPVVGFRKATTP